MEILQFCTKPSIYNMMETCATYSCRCFRNSRFTLEHILYQVGPNSWWKHYWSANMYKKCTQFPGSDRFLERYICNTQISTSLRVTFCIKLPRSLQAARYMFRFKRLLWNLTGVPVVLLLKRQSCPGRFVISLPSVPTWRPRDDADLGQIGSGDAL